MAMSVGALLGTLRLDNDHYMRTLKNTEAATRAEAAKSAQAIDRTSARIQAARDKEADAAGRVRVAESTLDRLRQSSKVTADRLVAAEEKLAAAKRAHAAATRNASAATRDHDRALRDYAASAGRATSRLQTLNAVLGALVRNRNTTLNVDADTAAATAKIARLANLNKRITVNVDADTGMAMVKIAGLGIAANAAAGSTSGLGRGLLMVGAVSALAAPAVGLVSTALVGLPGLFSVVGASATAIALGMDGIKRAAGVAAPAMDRLKAAVSGVFEARLTPVFQRIADVLLPGITRGMMNIAGALSGLARDFVGVITSAQGMNLINQILFNTATFLGRIGPFVQGMTRGFLTLSAVGSAALVRFAVVLNDFGLKFDAMVQRLANNGTLAAAFDQLGISVGILLDFFLRLTEAGVGMMARIGPQMNSFLQTLSNSIIALMPFLEAVSLLFFALGEAVLRAVTPVLLWMIPGITWLKDQFLALPLPIQNVIGGFIGFAMIAGVASRALMFLFGPLFRVITMLAPLVWWVIQAAAQFAVFVGRVLWTAAVTVGQMTWMALTTIARYASIAFWAGVHGAAMAARWLGSMIWMGLQTAFHMTVMVARTVGGFLAASFWAGVHGAAMVAKWLGHLIWMGLQTTFRMGIVVAQTVGGFLAASFWAGVHGAAMVAKWLGHLIFMGLQTTFRMALVVGSVIGGFLSTVFWAGVHGAAMVATWLGHMIWLGIQTGIRMLAVTASVIGGFLSTVFWAGVHGAAMVGTWLGHMAVMAAQTAARMAVTVAAVVGGWITMGVQALIHAARMAAAWVVAMGPVGWVIATVIALVALIIANWDTVRHWTGIIWNAIVGVVVGAWDAIVRGVSAAAGWLWNNVLRPVWDAIGAAWRGLLDGMNWVWLHILRPCWDAVAGAARWLYDNILRPVFGAIGGAWGGLLDGMNWMWLNVLRPCWDALNAGARFMWDHVLRPIIGAIAGAWRGMGDGMRWVRDHIIQPVFDAIQGSIGHMRDAFQAAVDFIGRVWNGIRGLLAKPVNFMIDHVYNGGIKAAWDKVAGWLKLPGLPGMGRIPENKKGGIIPGYTPGRDTTLSWVSGGEAIMRPEWTRAMGPGYVNYMNHLARTGGAGAVRAATGMGPGLDGGLNGIPTATLGSHARDHRAAEVKNGRPAFAGGGHTWQLLWDIVRRRFPDISLTSAYKDRIGDPGYHGRGQAIDVGYGDYSKHAGVASWIAGEYPQSTELISAQFRGGLGIKNGRPMRYSPGTTAAHANHVHWAMAGPPGKGTGMGGAGGFFFDVVEIVKQWWKDFQTKPMQDKANELGGKFGDTPFAGFGKPMGGKILEGSFKPVIDRAHDIIQHIMDWIASVFGALFGGGGGNAEAFRPVGLQALAIAGQPATWIDLLIRRMNQESGGNPGAVNNWDSNARAGHPSAGLMQVIGPTYQAYKHPLFDFPPHVGGTSMHPLSNILASIRYTLARYGSLSAWGRPGGYDSGGWLEPGTTRAVNKTGKPEAVLTSEQWRQVASGGITRQYNLTVVNASNTEVDLRQQFRRMEILGGL